MDVGGIMDKHEKINQSPSREFRQEQHDSKHEVAHTKLEHAEAKHHERISSEQARLDAVEQAAPAETHHNHQPDSPTAHHGVFTHRQREASFARHMSGVQATMRTPERLFSKVIHTKVIESISDGVGSTIARPDALLAGSLSAFVLVTAVYLLAKQYGYPLSGFETIGAFVLGWILGLIYDYTRTLISGGRSS